MLSWPAGYCKSQRLCEAKISMPILQAWGVNVDGYAWVSHEQCDKDVPHHAIAGTALGRRSQ